MNEVRSDFEVLFCKVLNGCAFSVSYTPCFERNPSLVKLFLKTTRTKQPTPHRQKYDDACCIIFSKPSNCVSMRQVNLHNPGVVGQPTQWRWLPSFEGRWPQIIVIWMTNGPIATQIIPVLSWKIKVGNGKMESKWLIDGYFFWGVWISGSLVNVPMFPSIFFRGTNQKYKSCTHVLEKKLGFNSVTKVTLSSAGIPRL